MIQKDKLNAENLTAFFDLIKKESELCYDYHTYSDNLEYFDLIGLKKLIGIKEQWRQLEISIGQIVQEKEVYENIKAVWIEQENKDFAEEYHSLKFNSLNIKEQTNYILNDYYNVMSNLSPENLHQDGEASHCTVAYHSIILQQRWKNLEQKIGYKLEGQDFPRMAEFFDE